MSPDPFTCLRCGGPVSEITRRCTLCGAERLAPRQRYAFGFAPPGDSARRGPAGPGKAWLRAGQGLALAVTVRIAMVGVEFSPGYHDTISITFAAGLVITGIVLLLMSLFLGWWPASRPFIPFAGLVFVGCIAFARVVVTGVVDHERSRRAEMAEQVAGLRGAANLLAGTAGALAAGDLGPPPSGAEAKEVWVVRRYLQAFERHLHEVGERHGVEGSEAPDTFQTARYVAAAGAHPEVGRYWEGLRACADEIRRTLPSWRDSTFGTLRREAGMTRRQIARLGRPSGDDDGDELDRWSLEAAMADAALAYHRYLVSIDGHVSYDARRGVAMFDRQDELDRANLLEQRMQATIHERNAYIERHRAAFAALPDSFQATFH